jgi:hypothetical protein
MIDETIVKIRQRVEQTSRLEDDRKRELLELLDTLKTEVQHLAKTRQEQAESITRFAELSTHESTRQERDARLVDTSLEGLAASVRKFEVSHPRLVEVVNQICTTLADMGI